MIKMLVPVTLTGLALTAAAGTICPGSIAPDAFGHDPDSAATGCNTLITINSDLSVAVTVPDPVPYDFGGISGDDNLVGIVNDSALAITSLHLNASGIFGLDGDGICTYTFTGDGYCTPSAVARTNPQDYYGPSTTFTIDNPNNGFVRFGPALAGHSSTFFSLEEAPSARLTANAVRTEAAPEPATFWLGGAALGAIATLRFRKAARR